MNLNAHFAWALAMWGSADIAREDGNLMLAPIGYYYSAFHAAYALLNTFRGIEDETFKRMGHTKLGELVERLMEPKHALAFGVLRDIRETINYLGGESSAQKLRIVRGHPFGFKLETGKVSYEQTVLLARDMSENFILAVLDSFKRCDYTAVDRVPKPGDEEWIDEYLQDDVLLGVIPRGTGGARILTRAFSLINPERYQRPDGRTK